MIIVHCCHFLFQVIPEAWDHGFNRSEFERHLKKDLLNMFDALFPDKYDEVFRAINFFYSPWPNIHDEDANREAFNVVRGPLILSSFHVIGHS